MKQKQLIKHLKKHYKIKRPNLLTKLIILILLILFFLYIAKPELITEFFYKIISPIKILFFQQK